MKNGPNIIPIVYTSLIPVDTIALEHTIPNYKHIYTLLKRDKANIDFPNTYFQYLSDSRNKVIYNIGQYLCGTVICDHTE